MQVSGITILGLGALGSALVRAVKRHNLPVRSIYNRTSEKAGKLARREGISISGAFPADADELGDLIFITVADAAIGEVAEKLGELSDDFSGKTVVHCSGNETSDLLHPLAVKGAETAAFHPLQSFTRTSGADDFDGIYFSIEGSDAAKDLLKSIAEHIGAQCFEVNSESKPYLHAAAVMASNYLVALIDASAGIGALGKLSENDLRKALLPLMQTTLENASGNELTEALSGPIVRGDVQTVEKHLELLEDDRDLSLLYRSLGRRALEVAGRSGRTDQAAISALKLLLEDERYADR